MRRIVIAICLFVAASAGSALGQPQQIALEPKVNLDEQVRTIRDVLNRNLERELLRRDTAEDFLLRLERVVRQMDQEKANVYGALPRESQRRYSMVLNDIEHALFRATEQQIDRSSDLVDRIRKEIMMTRSFSQKARTVALREADGVVEVTGAVEDIQEQKALEHLILKSGAARVVSRLLVVE